jgi:hypothetical protein
MSFKARDEMHLRLSFESLMDDDIEFVYKLTTLGFNIKSLVFGVLDYFFSFLRTYEEKKLKHITCCF